MANRNAMTLDRLGVDMLDAEEEARIRELIAAGTWPKGWDGDEPTADTPMDAVLRETGPSNHFSSERGHDHHRYTHDRRAGGAPDL